MSLSVSFVSAVRAPAGILPDGTLAESITLTSPAGVSAVILNFGATLQSLISPDRHGRLADVLLGHDDLAGYVDHPGFLGVTVGRYANRIAGGSFELNGDACQLPLNDGSNTLHGGGEGFDRAVWEIISVDSGPTARLVLGHHSPDGHSGFPGTVDATVTYMLDQAGALTISFDATVDRPTILNMTNHAVFNLGGEGAPEGAMDHLLTIAAERYTPVDAALIPTGELRQVEGTPFDFRAPRRIGRSVRDGRDRQIRFGRGYDHNWVLDKGVTADPELVARLEDPASGRVLDVSSTEPGLQFYSGNFFDGTLMGKQGTLYRMGEGIALEPQKFPDSPNKPHFPSARVDPGKPYSHVMIYRLSVRDEASE